MTTYNPEIHAAVCAIIAPKTGKMTASAFAKLAGVTAATVSQYKSQTYAANPAAIETRFANALAGRDSSTRLEPLPTVTTFITEQVFEALDITLNVDGITVISGRAGTGKTQAAMLFKKSNTRVHLLKLSPSTTSAGGLQRAFWESLGQPGIPKGGTRLDAIIAKMKGAELLFILDDAHMLTASAWNLMCHLRDETACGFALIGNPEIIRTAGRFEQWKSRVGRTYDVDFCTSEKNRYTDQSLADLTDSLMAHWLVGFDAARLALTKSIRDIAVKTGSPRIVAEILRTCRYFLKLETPAGEALNLAVANMSLPQSFAGVSRVDLTTESAEKHKELEGGAQ